uniref:Uncharacterized protein n=1 Tax=Mycolicibacterium phage phi1_186018 TaxID=3236641 RepID=A0AB39AKW6_9CAUD
MQPYLTKWGRNRYADAPARTYTRAREPGQATPPTLTG